MKSTASHWDNQIEEWKYTYDHEPSYQISNFGRVKGKRGQIIKTPEDKDGYYQFGMLYDNGNKKWERVSRIVMYYFSNQDIMADYYFDKNYIVDHIDENKTNNNILNLRWATYGQNRQNRKKIRGFYYRKRDKNFQARITVDGKSIYLGKFINPIYAQQTYQIASIKYFGEFSPFYKTGPIKIKPKIRKIAQ